jgi:hypothetical protein
MDEQKKKEELAFQNAARRLSIEDVVEAAESLIPKHGQRVRN